MSYRFLLVPEKQVGEFCVAQCSKLAKDINYRLPVPSKVSSRKLSPFFLHKQEKLWTVVKGYELQVLISSRKANGSFVLLNAQN